MPCRLQKISRASVLRHILRMDSGLTMMLLTHFYPGYSGNLNAGLGEGQGTALLSALHSRLPEGTVWVPHSTEAEKSWWAAALSEQSQEKRTCEPSEGATVERPEPGTTGAHAPGGGAAQGAGEPPQRALHRGLHDDVPDQAGRQGTGAHDWLGQENSR